MKLLVLLALALQYVATQVDGGKCTERTRVRDRERETGVERDCEKERNVEREGREWGRGRWKNEIKGGVRTARVRASAVTYLAVAVVAVVIAAATTTRIE